jgi:hypothetical protein
MHSPFILNITQESEAEVTTVEKAEAFANSFLEENNFVSEGGHWGGGHCDWYYVGSQGRFTELLGGVGAVRYDGQPELLELCNKLAEEYDYLDSECEDVVSLRVGDWLVIVDYHM